MVGSAPRSLADEITHSFRLLIAAAAAMLTIVVVAFSWLSLVTEPTLDRAAAAVRVGDAAHASLLDAQASLRGYVVTGDTAALQGFAVAHTALQQEMASLTRAQDAAVREVAGRLRAAEGSWEAGWGRLAADPATRTRLMSHGTELDPSLLAGFVRSGRAPFTAALAAAQQTVRLAEAAERHQRRLAVGVVVTSAVMLLGIAVAVAVSTIHRRRLLRQRVLGPITVLLEKVRLVGQGEFSTSFAMRAPAELLELRDELVHMTASLKFQQQALAARADDAAQTARRLEHVVDFARDVSGSLTLGNVLDAVASSSRRLLESPRARVWLLEEDGRTLRLAHDSLAADPPTVGMTHAVGASGVGRAFADGRLCYSLGLTGEPFTEDGALLALSLPLFKGSRGIGVLELAVSDRARRLRSDTAQVLRAMASHAATAIDAALLHARVESLSLSDPLTGLANRRRLDQDLAVEVDRALRHQGGLAFLMVDVDHFKRVNDEMGHRAGDLVLQQVAHLLAAQMRSGDSAYRYGGEEFAVLARDADLGGAMVVAERIRRAVEDSSLTAGNAQQITVSIGVAVLPLHAATAEDVVRLADAALYDAKRDGRNRTAAAPPAIPAPRVALR